jgi:hypothetical protein
MNVKLRLNDQYTFSISQEQMQDRLVEVALFCDGRFVPCKYWATTWVGEDYDDDVIRMQDGMEVLDLLCYAKHYIYIEAEEFIWEQEHV